MAHDSGDEPRRGEARQPRRRRGRRRRAEARARSDAARAARRASAIKDGVEVAVDGNPAALVDLSTVGAQVRVADGAQAQPARARDHGRRQDRGEVQRATIAWAAFEMPKGMPTRYRAGIDFGATPTPSASRASPKKTQEDATKVVRVSSYVSQLGDDAAVAHDRLVAIRSGRDQADRHAAHLFQPRDVALRLGRQLRVVARALGRRRPARPRLVDRRDRAARCSGRTGTR